MAKRNRQTIQRFRDEKRELAGREVTERGISEVKQSVRPLNDLQDQMKYALRSSQVVVISAPAGCGKSYVSVSDTVDKLKKGEIDKIILSRPSVGMGNTLGLLKGGLREKYEPFLLAVVDVITGRYGHAFYETQLGNKNIEFAPLEYIRGRSFEDSVIILDEAQDVKPEEMYTILTRLGEHSQLIILGDPTQCDLKGVQNGLDWLEEFVHKHDLSDYVCFIKGSSDDIVRSGFCKAVVKAKEASHGKIY